MAYCKETKSLCLKRKRKEDYVKRQKPHFSLQETFHLVGQIVLPPCACLQNLPNKGKLPASLTKLRSLWENNVTFSKCLLGESGDLSVSMGPSDGLEVVPCRLCHLKEPHGAPDVQLSRRFTVWP